MRLGRVWLLGAVVGAALAAMAVLLAARTRARAHQAEVQANVLPEATGAIAEIAMHYVPLMEPLVAPAYTDFLRALPNDVHVRVVMARSSGPEARAMLGRFLDQIDPSGGWRDRTQVVETQGPITTWSKDRALVTGKQRPDGIALLVAPAEPSDAWPERHNDWATVAALADASHGMLLAEVAPFDFDAGDFAATDAALIVDANLIEKNRHRGLGDAIELRKRLAGWFHMPVIVLGTRPGDTPRHHLSMYMTPLDANVVLVGDPAQAARLVGNDFAPGEDSVDTGEALRADFSPETQRRFDRAADDLAARGFEVVRIPNVPFEDKTYFSYTNGVYETRDGRRIAYMPVYDEPALDREARRIYEGLGWEVRPIRVRGIYAQHGTIGCLVNVLGRR